MKRFFLLPAHPGARGLLARAVVALIIIGLSLLFFAICLYVAERMAHFAWARGKFTPDHRVEMNFEPARDPERCYTFPPNAAIQFDYYVHGRPAAKTKTFTDEFGRRIDGFGPREKMLQNKRAAVFLGASDVFGLGVADNQTLGAHFYLHNGDHRVYNYGYPGITSNQMLAWLRSDASTREVREKAPLFVYVAVPSHIRRSIGSARNIGVWYENCRAYEFDESGGIMREGTFQELRPWSVAIAKWFYETHLGTAFLNRFDFPFTIGIADVRHFFFTLRAMDAAAKARFPGARFIVVLLAREDPEEVFFTPLVEMLQKDGIEYVDARAGVYPTLWQDTHLSGVSYARVALKLNDKFHRR